MFELLVRLECEREALRRRLLKPSGRYGNSYFGVALFVLAASMLSGPLEIVILPVMLIPVAFIFILGLFSVISIIMAPVGVMLW